MATTPSTSTARVGAEPTPSTYTRMISGVSVEFPFEPYATQISVVHSVIRALKSSRSVLVESPTGTGKTIALLSAALAWRLKHDCDLQQAERERIVDKLRSLENCYHSDTKNEAVIDLSDNFATPKMGETVEMSCSSESQIKTKDDSRDIDNAMAIWDSKSDKKEINDDDDDDFIVPSSLRKAPGLKIEPATPPPFKIDYKSPVKSEKFNVDEASIGGKPFSGLHSDAKSTNVSVESNRSEKDENKRSKIFYGTRTHSQIAQIIRELNRSPYAEGLNYTVLASREQSCINADVRDRRDIDINSACREAGCVYRSNLRSAYKDTAHLLRPAIADGIRSLRDTGGVQPKTCWDMEDLVAIAEQSALKQAFQDAFADARSVILASGTLCPMESFKVELEVPFLQLEGRHVIESDRFYVAALSTGPTGQEMRCTQREKSSAWWQEELGRIVLQVCTRVPGGVLVFFASYTDMERAHIRWGERGLLRAMLEFKAVVLEPRHTSELDECLRIHRDAVEQPWQVGRTVTGSLLLAVCRGKVAEGIDFADAHARAVISVGIPLPNFGDPQVVQKRQYNDSLYIPSNRQAAAGNKTMTAHLSGAKWYEIQGFRALNQALGRCLRHKNDWGALILVDCRFVGSAEGPKMRQGVSRWIREAMRQYDNFDAFAEHLGEFVWKLQKEKQGQQAGPAATDSTGVTPALSRLNTRRNFGGPVAGTPSSAESCERSVLGGRQGDVDTPTTAKTLGTRRR